MPSAATPFLTASRCVAVCCSVLQCGAVCFRACVAIHCSALQYIATQHTVVVGA